MLAGRTLGQYQIIEEIGRGGMAIVFRAYQPSLSRRVAIKVLPAALAIDPDFVQRFLHEARAAASLDHPNIVTVHDVGEQDGTYFIVMQELQGESLGALLRREGRLSFQRASRILTQVASALDYAHSRGFVHRDVKPGNIVVGPGDRAVLTDFGIAKALSGTRLTQSGVMIGTPQYMAPEQIKGDPVGPATDIYSLGIVLYEMLTGRVPFDADNATAVMYKQVHEQPAAARMVVPTLPLVVDHVLATALSKHPGQRFPSAVSMAAALSGEGSAQPTAPVTPQPAVIGPTAQTVQQTTSRLASRNLLALGGVVIVMTALLGLFMAIAGGRTDEAASQPARAAMVPSLTPLPLATAERNMETLATAVYFGTAESETEVKPVAVSSQTINTYAGPDRTFPEQGQLAAGDTKEVLGRTADNSWLLLCCIDGEPVWIESLLVDVSGTLDDVAVTSVAMPPPATLMAPPPSTPTPGVPEFIVSAGAARVRSGPGTDYPEIGQLRQGEAVAITGRNADISWWQVCCIRGEQGWIRADLGEATGVLDGIPVIVDVLPPPARAGRVFFASDKGGYAHVYVISDKGGSPQPLTQGSEYYWNPEALDDGRRLAFVSKIAGNTEVFVTTADGASQRAISNHPAVDDHPSWFPNGRELAFASDRSGSWQVYRMNDDGSGVRQLTWGAGDNRFTAVSPSGDAIAYVALGNPYPVVQLMVMAADGSAQHAVLTYSSRKQRDDPGRFVFRPDWSPDGTTLAFGADDDNDGLISILLIDIADNDVRRLIDDGNSPAWSPDGQRIVYKPAGEPQILYLANSDGSQVYQLTGANYNSWSPDWTR